MAGGGTMADCYRKTNLVQKSRSAHVILEVHSRPGKSTTGSNFHNYLLQQGCKDWQDITALAGGCSEVRPGHVFISQSAAFSVHNTGDFQSMKV